MSFVPKLTSDHRSAGPAGLPRIALAFSLTLVVRDQRGETNTEQQRHNSPHSWSDLHKGSLSSFDLVIQSSALVAEGDSDLKHLNGGPGADEFSNFR